MAGPARAGHITDLTARIERRRVVGGADQRIPQNGLARVKLLVNGCGRVLARHKITYDLRRLGLNGLIRRVEHTHTYVVTGVPLQPPG